MLLGVQGCGKSLAAKAVAGTWGTPLMRLDFGALYNKFLGETERNLREALRVADAMAPAVLWMDEIEKGIATNDNDGGESRRILGTLLTWMADGGSTHNATISATTITRNIDPVLLERGRMTQLQQGYDHDAPNTLRGLAYVAFQELATRISHRNTGRYSDDPVADRIMVRIAADENLHMVFYRDILGAALKIQPSAAVRAIVDEILAFEMPGAAIPGFLRKAAQIAKAGIYDLRVHRDEVLLPIIRHWRLFELEGLDAAAEEARRRLAEHLEALDVAARRFEERLAAAPVARLGPAD